MAHGFIGSHHHSILASRVAMVAHVLFLTTAVLMLVWLLHYRGGINIQSEDPEQIFNVRATIDTCSISSCSSTTLFCSVLDKYEQELTFHDRYSFEEQLFTNCLLP